MPSDGEALYNIIAESEFFKAIYEGFKGGGHALVIEMRAEGSGGLGGLICGCCTGYFGLRDVPSFGSGTPASYVFAVIAEFRAHGFNKGRRVGCIGFWHV